jgi:hypothetical protein
MDSPVGDNSKKMSDNKSVKDGFNRFELLRQLSHVEMAVFFELNRRCSRDGRSFLRRVVMVELAEQSAVSHKGVYNAITGLTEKGLKRRDADTGDIVLLLNLGLRLRDSEKY